MKVMALLKFTIVMVMVGYIDKGEAQAPPLPPPQAPSLPPPLPHPQAPPLPPSLPPSLSPPQAPSLPPSLPPPQAPSLPPSLPPSLSPPQAPSLPPSLPPPQAPSLPPSEAPSLEECYAKCFILCITEPNQSLCTCTNQCLQKCITQSLPPFAIDQHSQNLSYCKIGCATSLCSNMSKTHNPDGKNMESCVGSCSNKCTMSYSSSSP